jgi:hypothetical protein
VSARCSQLRLTAEVAAPRSKLTQLKAPAFVLNEASLRQDRFPALIVEPAAHLATEDPDYARRSRVRVIGGDGVMIRIPAKWSTE